MSKKTLRMLGVDIGASSGRGILGEFDGDRLKVNEIHRFINEPCMSDNSLTWDLNALGAGVTEAVTRGVAEGVSTVGIDTWGVDYVLTDASGVPVAPARHYRDASCAAGHTEHEKAMSRRELYSVSGIQSLDFNTVYQLTADNLYRREALSRAAGLLFMPDYFGYLLTGERACEYTVASTGAMLDARTRDFSPEILASLGVERRLFAPLVTPGHTLGHLLPVFGNDANVINVASHDTASAVLAVPASAGEFVYISSGTWSLMGTELSSPRTGDDAWRLNFTNEGGACGEIRFLKNIMGLWLLQESRRQWRREGKEISFDELSAAADAAEPFRSIIDPDDPSFVAPGDMPRRIADFCARTSQPVPETPGQIARVIFDSLALCYRRTAGMIASLTGNTPSAIYVVGGGSKEELLNRVTADVTGLPVIAGPSEATAIGNIVMQAIAAGELSGKSEARELIRRSFSVRVYEPSGERDAADCAYGRFLTIVGMRRESGEDANA